MGDFIAIVEALGGGLSAAVIAGLAFCAWALWRRVSTLQDARLEDALSFAAQSAERDRDHRDLMRSMEEAVRGNSDQLRELRHQINRRSGE